jgi:hypothetical protein
VAEWTYTTDKLPPEGRVVTVLNGNIEQTLVFERGLWWVPDRSMYVYFTPKLWRLS